MQTRDRFSRVVLRVISVLFTLAAGAQEAEQASFPPPGTTGNAKNVPFFGKSDAKGNPVRLARKTGHVSNYDEALVKKYTLPDPLKMTDGRIVDSAELWKNERRGEILKLYETQIYGRVPANAPKVTWRLVSTDEDGTQHIQGRMGDYPDGPKIGLTLNLPSDAKTAVPEDWKLFIDFADGHYPARPDSR